MTTIALPVLCTCELKSTQGLGLRSIPVIHSGNSVHSSKRTHRKKYTFNSTVNVEIMSKMFKNKNKSNFVAKYPNKMLIEPYNDGKVNHFSVSH